MPFREKTAWISLISMTGIYGIYFWTVIRAGEQARDFRFSGLMATVIALIIVQILLTGIAAIMAPKDANRPRDEREKLIELRATRMAYAGLATGICLACLFGALDPPIVFDTNSLLMVLVTAELVRSGSQIVQYRRSA